MLIVNSLDAMFKMFPQDLNSKIYPYFNKYPIHISVVVMNPSSDHMLYVNVNNNNTLITEIIDILVY